MNQRNCGGRKAYANAVHSGMSGDYRAVLEELIESDRFDQIFFTRVFDGRNLVTINGGGSLRMMYRRR